MGIWTQSKVPATSGVINCMAKKKGHLSATPPRATPKKEGEKAMHICANILTIVSTLHRARSRSSTLHNSGLTGDTITLNRQSSNEVCIMSLSVLTCLCMSVKATLHCATQKLCQQAGKECQTPEPLIYGLNKV